MNPNTQKSLNALIARVLGGEMSQAQLANSYENVSKNQDLTLDEKEPALFEIEQQLRGRFPLAANRLFGKSDEKFRQMLAVVLERHKATWNLASNRVLTKVKTGGDKLRGTWDTDAYISYKDDNKKRATLEIRRKTTADLPYAVVTLLQIGSGEHDPLFEKEYALTDFDQADKDYTALVSELLGGPTD